MNIVDNTLNSTISAFTAAEYQQYFEKKAEAELPPDTDLETREHAQYTRLNWQRSARIRRTYRVSEDLQSVINAIDHPQIWLVITEVWCGDSAKNLPYMEKMAAINPLIKLRIILRDEHPEIIDRYLTNGTRSIPIVIAFDQAGIEIFRWGPRPHEAAELVASLKKQGLEKPQFLEQLHLWYGRNRGKVLEKEFLHLIS